ncbi:hypothetical protein O6H91_21G011900 [Diphasiastrum complanatum]|uniref:Uncharacterized protein n=1 Tax=Diphasiastrum complanatum TaxID=34168 RepID=A0ACC2AHT7_DIPCM|nr:hypothetical protein O6H91_21G011900 [Diphasiastrum complanatum]
MDSRMPWLLLLLLITFAALDLVLVSAVDDVGGIGVLDEEQQQQAEKTTDLDSSYTHNLKQIDYLKSQLEDLEATLKAKDLSLQDKEKRIVFLESELDSVQNKGSQEVEERLIAARDRTSALEVEVDKLQEDARKLEIQLETFKKCVESSEAKITELSNKNSQITKTIERQQKRIYSAEEALQKAEAALKQAESEAARKTRELAKAAGAWLPPWFASRLNDLQELAIIEWGEHGEPVVNIISEKAYHISATAHEMAKPHLETVKEKWMPAVQQRWENAIVLIGPHVEMVKVKAGKGVDSAKSYLSPHVHRVQEALSPYTQLVREKARPYVDKVAVFVQPYFKATHKALRPHVEKAHKIYQNVLKSATAYHLQLHTFLHKSISKHETLATLATKEVTWFLYLLLQTLALLVVPAVGILLVFSSTFSGKKSNKSLRSSGGTHGGSSHKKKRSKQDY